MPGPGSEVGDATIEVHADTKGLRGEIKRAAKLAGADFGDEFGKELTQGLSHSANPALNELRSKFVKQGGGIGKQFARALSGEIKSDIARQNIDLAHAVNTGDWSKVLSGFDDLDDAIDDTKGKLLQLSRSSNSGLRGDVYKSAIASLERYGDEAKNAIKADKDLENEQKRLGSFFKEQNGNLNALSASTRREASETARAAASRRKSATAEIAADKARAAAADAAVKRIVSGFRRQRGEVDNNTSAFSKLKAAFAGFKMPSIPTGPLSKLDGTVQLVIGSIAAAGPQIAALGSGIGSTLTAALGSATIAAGGLAAAFGGIAAAAAYALPLAITSFKQMEKAGGAAGKAISNLKNVFKKVDVPAFTRQWSASLTTFANTLAKSLRFDTVAQNLGAATARITTAFTHVLDTKPWTNFVNAIEGPLSKALGSVGVGAAGAFSALLSILTAAAPLAKALAAQFATWGQALAASFSKGPGKKALTDFFAVASQSIGAILPLITNLGHVLGTIFMAGASSGNSFLTTLADLTGQFAAFLKTAGGQNALAQWFASGITVMNALLPLVGAVGKALADMVTPTTTASLVTFLDALTGIMPTISRLLGILGQVDILNVFATLLTTIASALQPILPLLENFASILGQALVTAVTSLAPVFGSLVSAFTEIVGALMPVIPVIAQVVASLATALAPVLKALGPVVASVVTAIAPLISQVAAALIPAISALVPIIASLAPVFAAVIKGVMPIVTTLVGALAPILKLIAPLFAALAPIVSALLAALAPFATVVATVATQLVSALMPVIMALLPIIQALAPAIIQLVIAAFFPLLNVVVQLLPVIMPLIQLLAQLVTWALKLITPIIQLIAPILNMVAGFLSFSAATKTVIGGLAKLGPIITGVGRAIQAGFLKVVDFFAAGPGKIGKALSSLPGKVGEIFTSLFTKVYPIIVRGIAKVLQWYIDLPGKIFNALFKVIAKVVSVFESLWSKARSITSSGASKVLSFFTSLPGKAIAGVQSLVSRLGSIFSSAFSRAGSAVSTGISKIVSFFRGLPGKITGALGNVGSMLSGIGGDIVRGLRDGITGAWHYVTDAISSLVDKIPGPIKKLLHINSPSKVMRDIGTSIPEGFGQGIGKDMGVSAAARGMANGAIDTTRKALDSHSPSKVFYDIGKDITAGLKAGVLDSKDDAVKAVTSVGKSITAEETKMIKDRSTQIMTAQKKAAYNQRKYVEQYNKTHKKKISSSEIYQMNSTEATKVAKQQLAAQIKQINAVQAALAKQAKTTKGLSPMNDLINQMSLTVKNGKVKKVYSSMAALKSAIDSGKLVIKSTTTFTSNFKKAAKNEKATLADFAVARQEMADKISAANDNLKSAIQTRSDYAASVADSGKQFASVLQAQQGATDKALTFSDIKTTMAKNLADLKAFKSNIEKLKAAGLNATTLQDIIAGGPEQAGDTAKLIAAGGKSAVSQINSLQGQINSAANGLGKETAGYFYDTGVQMAQGIVKGLQSQDKAIQAAMKKIIDNAAAAAKKKAKIKSPSRLFADEVGLPIAQGIGRGVLSGHRGIADALRTVVEPVSGTGVRGARGTTVAGPGRSLVVEEGAIQVTLPNTDPRLAASSLLDRMVRTFG